MPRGTSCYPPQCKKAWIYACDDNNPALFLNADYRSDEEKATALRALRNTLPETLAKQYQRQYDLQHLEAREQSMKQEGASTEELYAFRQLQFGDAAALRLQALAAERQAWQHRYQDYTLQRDQIHNAALSSDDKQKQLDALRRQLFSASEQQRAAALDRLQ